MDLSFEVTNQTMVRTDSYRVVNCSNEYLRCSFEFKSDDWNDLTKFVLFKYDKNVYRVALVGSAVIVPHEVLGSDYFIVSVYGVDNDNKRITSNRLNVYLGESGFTKDTSNPIPDTETDIVEDIYNRLNNTIELSVTYEDETTETFNVVVKDESS